MAPIGVPKVSFRLPGEALPQWVDLYNRLYRDRILFLGSDLDDELANQLVGIMVYLNAEDSSQDLFLYINSPGGAITSGFSVFDTMNHVEAKVHTICAGIAASMASLVLAGGESGCRLAFPHSRMMIHQPSGGGYGQASDVLLECQEITRLRQQVQETYVQVTGNDLNIIVRDLDRDNYLTVRNAMEYGELGLVDGIADRDTLNPPWSGSQKEREREESQRESRIDLKNLNWFIEKMQRGDMEGLDRRHF